MDAAIGRGRGGGVGTGSGDHDDDDDHDHDHDHDDHDHDHDHDGRGGVGRRGWGFLPWVVVVWMCGCGAERREWAGGGAEEAGGGSGEARADRPASGWDGAGDRDGGGDGVADGAVGTGGDARGEAEEAEAGAARLGLLGPDGWVLCGEPPPGMACIPGGPFVRGDDRGEPDERPAAEIEVSTFYLDRHEVTNAAYRRCMEAGACRLRHHYPRFQDPEQPVVAVTWEDARAYCAWAGKRLPTEAEWEKAARGGDGRVYAWGNEPPTCERSMYRGCEPAWARPVGSFAANPWGVFDLSGNAYEFVQDWYAPCYRGCAGECGAACFGRDPRGPCGGLEECPGRERRVLRGGSWFWPAEQLRVANRRGMRPDSGGHRLGFRCALDAPYERRPEPPSPPGTGVGPLTAAERETLFGVAGEPLPRRRFDDRHFALSNESDHALWLPYVAGLGGGYLGVGADQNYTLFAAARSEFAWLIDYDAVVTQAHRIYRALIVESVSPDEFLLRWEPFDEPATRELLEAAFAGDPDRAELLDLFAALRPAAGRYFERVAARRAPDGGPGSWLADPAWYRRVRAMFAADRVRVVLGDLLGAGAMPAIAAAQGALGVPMRVVYLSNAEEYFAYSEAFRRSVGAMPFDERSVVLRTVARRVPGGTRRAWHYQVEPARGFVDRLTVRRVERFASYADEASYSAEGGVSLFPGFSSGVSGGRGGDP